MSRAAKHLELGLAEVLADRPDDPHLVEEGCGESKMDGGAAEHALTLPERGLDGIKGNRSNDCDGH